MIDHLTTREFMAGDYKYIAGNVVDFGGRPSLIWSRYKLINGLYVFVDKDIFPASASQHKITSDFNNAFNAINVLSDDINCPEFTLVPM